MKQKKKMQHIVPRVYLKFFQIDERDNKSFVQCIDFSNKYKQAVERKGINDNIFKVKHFYYSKDFKNPYLLEDFLGENVEPIFEQVMHKVIKEEPLNEKLIGDMVFWMFVSKIRSPYIRENFKDSMGWFIGIESILKNRDYGDDKKKMIYKEILNIAKDTQIQLFANEEKMKKLLTVYYESLLFKRWKILKSKEEMPFLTNDNPGFSVNLNPQFEEDKVFYNNLDLNKSSIIYYILSPKYCIEILPLAKINEEIKFVLNTEIEYENTSNAMIEFINKGVFETKHKLLISNSYRLLIDTVKWKKKNANNL